MGSIFLPEEARGAGQLAATGLQLLFLKHGRDAEIQADALGARYAVQAGWAPSGVPDMLAMLARLDEIADCGVVPGWLGTHPAPARRPCSRGSWGRCNAVMAARRSPMAAGRSITT